MTILMAIRSSKFSACVKLLTVIPLLISALAVSGCETTSGILNSESTAGELYRIAKGQLNRRDYLGAVETFETLESRFPFGEFTQQAQLDVSYAYLKQFEYDNAIDAADRFIKLYPRNKNIDYAWYMKGLANFSRGGSTLERLFPRDMSRVDQSWLRASFSDFDTLVARYPNSIYAPDAIERMQFLHNEMARHELRTARYYYSRGAMVAAVNRIKHMLTHFEGSKHIGNGLAVMASAYDAMGEKTLQQDTLRVLQANEPRHPALAKLQ